MKNLKRIAIIILLSLICMANSNLYSLAMNVADEYKVLENVIIDGNVTTKDDTENTIEENNINEDTTKDKEILEKDDIEDKENKEQPINDEINIVEEITDNSIKDKSNEVFSNPENSEKPENSDNPDNNISTYSNNDKADTQILKDGTYEIETGISSSKVLEVIGAETYSGANIQIYTRNKAMCQRVNVKYVGEGYYTLRFAHSNLYMDVANGKNANGTNVWQCNYNGSDAQKWMIKDDGNGYYNIISKCSGTYLTVKNGKKSDCTNIEINAQRNDDSQRFKFNKVTPIVGEQTIQDGLYQIETGVSSTKVIEVFNASTISGGNVQIYTKNNNNCQKVNVKYEGNGYYSLSFYHSNKYLDVANGKTADGTNVWQCNKNGSDAQKWIIKNLGNGYYNIISKCSETYLTVTGGNTSNNTNIEISTLRNDNSQKFKFNKIEEVVGTQTIKDGTYEIETALDSNKVVEVINASTMSGGNVQIFSKNNAKCQKVNVQYIGDGYYTMKFEHSNMYLDVANGKNANGTNVWQCRYNGSDAQKWIIKDVGDGYYNIISKCSSTYLTVSEGSIANCTNIEINSYKNNNSQKFKFNKIEEFVGTQIIKDGTYEIETALHPNRVVEVINASTISGGNVQIFSRNNAKCQRVNVKYIGNGYYTMNFEHSGLYLDVANGNTMDKTNVWQCRYNGSDAQKWIIQDAGNGYYNIISKCSNTYLTVSGGNTANCTNIEINSNKNDNSQKFKFNEICNIKGEKTIEDGIYEIETAIDQNKAIEVKNATLCSGGNVQIFSKNNAKCQKVNIKYIGNGYYTMKFEHSSLYLDVANGETADGTNVWQCRYNGSDAQKWIIKDVGDGYYNIISKCSNTYLTVSGGNTANCTNIEINSNKNSNSQKFKFNKATQITGKKTIEDGIYEIETGVSNNKVIEVINATTESGGNVQIFSRNNAKCQKVAIKYVGEGYYTMKFEHSGLYLDVSNGETADGTNVWQCRYNGSDAQKWIIQDAGDGYYNIISKCSDTYLTVEGGRNSNCTNIEVNSKNNGNSQKFKFNEIKNLKGMDVSAHQGNINWEKVKKSDIDFVIIRCGYGQDLANQDDAMFLRNISECERLGIPYGVYIYSYALNETAALSEADHVLRLIKGHSPKFGIWFDMEDADGYKKRNGMPSNEMLVNICVAFCEKIKLQGYNVGIYASLSWLKNQLNDNRLDIYDKWVAQWNVTCTYNKKYVMWQYTNSGTVDGIEGYVDMNKYYM